MGIPNSFHQHYAVIHALALELRQKLVGAALTDAYTLSREELVLVFDMPDGNLFTIKVVQQYQTCFLFFEEGKPGKVSNAQSCFEPVFKMTIAGVGQHPFNRSFALQFSNKMELVFKLYDGLVNLILFDQGVAIDLFRKNINSDWELTPASFIGKSSPDQIEAVQFFVYRRAGTHPYYLSLTQQSDELISRSESIMEAYSQFSRLALAHYRFFYQKQQLISNLHHQIDRTNKHVLELEKVALQRNDRITDEEIANIIMANLDRIPPGSTEAELFDFYRNRQLKIRLKKDLNAQQNAAYYYRKSKNVAIEFNRQEEEIGKLKKRLQELNSILLQAEAAVSFREIKGFVKEPAPQVKQFPFRQFPVDGFDIWVGKSASNNDELTMRFAHKNDLWLHAKDVTGSHVIIKWKPGKIFPVRVIETAAQIAAYYSKLKGSNLVPVTYTPRKFVRKPKGAETGSVVVDKEEVLMVKPGLPL